MQVLLPKSALRWPINSRPLQRWPAPKRCKETRMNRCRSFFERADRDVRTLGLNFYKKAKFANSFKWRLLENGVGKELADEVTRRLVVHLSGDNTGFDTKFSLPTPNPPPSEAEARSNNAKSLFAAGNKCMSQCAFPEAVDFYTEVVKIDPRHAGALNNLGAALCRGESLPARQRVTFIKPSI